MALFLIPGGDGEGGGGSIGKGEARRQLTAVFADVRAHFAVLDALEKEDAEAAGADTWIKTLGPYLRHIRNLWSVYRLNTGGGGASNTGKSLCPPAPWGEGGRAEYRAFRNPKP